MQNIQTWSPPAAFDPSNPSQQPLQYYSPFEMGYRSAYWNEQPTTVTNLTGIIPESRIAQVGIVAALAATTYFGFQHMRSKGLMGLGRARRSRRERK